MRKVSCDEIKNIQLEILRRFIGICEKHQLRYSVMDGTLIGTIRHQGFIPWDDDIDVAMPREDYDKFISIYKREYNNDTIKIIDRIEEKHYHMLFAKLHDTSTVLREKRVIDKYAMLYGVYIDVFPLDYIPQDKRIRKKILRRNYYILKMISMRVVNKEVPHNNKIKAFVYNIMRDAIRIIPISTLTGIEEKRIRKYSKKHQDSGLVRELAFADPDFDYAFQEEDLASYITKQFENVNVNVPIGYDRILSSQYGDYMTLPPESKRVNHGLEVYYKE